MFVTSAEFLPQHHAQRQATLQIISAAEASGHPRVAEMNRQVVGNLDKIITALESEGNDEKEAAAVRPDPLSEAAARRHELTRAKAVQALRELDRAGTLVTFAGVAQAAEISRSWLYTQPDISGQIRRLREKNTWCRLRRHHPGRPAGHRGVAARQAHRRPRPQQATRGRERPAPLPARPRTRRPAVSTDPIR